MTTYPLTRHETVTRFLSVLAGQGSSAGQLLELHESLLDECAAVGASYDPAEDAALMRRPAG